MKAPLAPVLRLSGSTHVSTEYSLWRDPESARGIFIVDSDAIHERVRPHDLARLARAHDIRCLMLSTSSCRDRDFSSELRRLWRTLEDVAKENGIADLAIADAGPAALDAVLSCGTMAPTLVQLELHPYCQSPSIVTWCRSHGLAVQARHPFGPRMRDGLELNTHSFLRELAARHHVTVAHVCAAWGLRRAGSIMLRNAELDLFTKHSVADISLSPEDLRRIDGLNCDWRVDADPGALRTLFWCGDPNPVRVEHRPTFGLRDGLYKRLHLSVSRSERRNKALTEALWRYFFNLPATFRHRVAPSPVSPLAVRLRDDLRRDGFAASSLQELGLSDLLEPLTQRARQTPADEHGTAPYHLRTKGEPLLSRVSSAPDVVAAAEAYCQMKLLCDYDGGPLLNYIEGRPTMPREQQLWHSDVEDYCVVKVYTYLSDVIANHDGPLEYMRGTHPFGPLSVDVAKLWRYSFVQDATPLSAHQVTSDMLFGHVSPELLCRLTGRAGTVWIFDARGLHRGGHVLRGQRIVGISTMLAPNQIHPWTPRASPWNLLTFPLRWRTNTALNPVAARRSWPPSSFDLMRWGLLHLLRLGRDRGR